MLQCNIRVTNGTQTTGDYTEEFIAASKVNGRMISARIYQGVVEVFDDTKINSINPYYECNLLKSVMKIVELELSGLYFLDKQRYTDIQFGVSPDLGNTFYYVSYGAFTVVSCERDLENMITKVVLYDDLINSMEKFELDLTYPMTNKAFLDTVATELGLTVGSSIPSTGVMALNREVETYTNSYTYRDVLDDFAEILGGIILVKNGILELRKPTAISGVLNEEQLSTIKIQEEFGSVSNIVLARNPQEDNVYYPAEIGTDSIIRIDDNQIVEGTLVDGANDRTPYLSYIYDNIRTWPSYYAVDLESYGYLLYEPGDLLTFTVPDNEGTPITIQTLWLSDSISIAQGIKEDMTCKLYVSAETDLSKSTSESRRERNTYLYVDKVNGEIRARVDGVDTVLYGDGTEENVGLLKQVSEIKVTTGKIQSTVENDVVTKDNITTYGYQTKSQVTQEAERIMGTLETTVTQNGEAIRNIEGGIKVELVTDTTPSYTKVTVGNSESRVRGVFTNTSLNFETGSGNNIVRLAWLDADDGLGASALSIGDPTSSANRWKIFTRQSGSHLTFTRHT